MADAFLLYGLSRFGVFPVTAENRFRTACVQVVSRGSPRCVVAYEESSMSCARARTWRVEGRKGAVSGTQIAVGNIVKGKRVRKMQ